MTVELWENDTQVRISRAPGKEVRPALNIAASSVPCVTMLTDHQPHSTIGMTVIANSMFNIVHWCSA